jgi:hypothetical protein
MIVQMVWTLHQEVVNRICDLWDSPNVDLFATKWIFASLIITLLSLMTESTVYLSLRMECMLTHSLPSLWFNQSWTRYASSWAITEPPESRMGRYFSGHAQQTKWRSWRQAFSATTMFRWRWEGDKLISSLDNRNLRNFWLTGQLGLWMKVERWVLKFVSSSRSNDRPVAGCSLMALHWNIWENVHWLALHCRAV